LEYRNLPGVLSGVLRGGGLDDDIFTCMYITSVRLSRDWMGKTYRWKTMGTRYFLFSSSVGPIFSVV